MGQRNKLFLFITLQQKAKSAGGVLKLTFEDYSGTFCFVHVCIYGAIFTILGRPTLSLTVILCDYDTLWIGVKIPESLNKI